MWNNQVYLRPGIYNQVYMLNNQVWVKIQRPEKPQVSDLCMMSMLSIHEQKLGGPQFGHPYTMGLGLDSTHTLW